jgi:hypothetical protein
MQHLISLEAKTVDRLSGIGDSCVRAQVRCPIGHTEIIFYMADVLCMADVLLATRREYSVCRMLITLHRENKKTRTVFPG